MLLYVDAFRTGSTINSGKVFMFTGITEGAYNFFLNRCFFHEFFDDRLLIEFMNHWLFECLMDSRPFELFFYELLMRLVDYWLFNFMNYFFVLLMNYGFVDFCYFLLMDDRLMVLMDDVLMLFVNDIFMVLVNDVLMMLMDYFSVMFFNYWLCYMGLNSFRKIGLINNGWSSMAFKDTFFFVPDYGGCLFVGSLYNGFV